MDADEDVPPRQAEVILPELRDVRKELADVRIALAACRAELDAFSRRQNELYEKQGWLESELADSLLQERGAM